MRPRPSLRWASPLLAVLVFVAGVSGVAYAHWNTSGSGTGTATTGTLSFEVQALVGGDASAAQSAQSTTLVPGGSADAILRVRNPNSQTVHVTAVTGGTATASGGCPTSSVQFTSPTSLALAAVQYTIAGGASKLLTLPAAVTLDATAPQACMGATFSFLVTVTVQT